ncbi:putative RING-H2 finger protein ATL21A [Cornus florida]|uniref:putative RING-H2 finger protein ATL21A n=1 Tax=Cornus florida TaxID=4283 RepID=UPI002899FE93|nr:putative RING-H2 finger protein ATL21A [Cornus florida]
MKIRVSKVPKTKIKKMNTFTLFLFFSSSFTYTVFGRDKCPPSFCGDGPPLVKFPFQLPDVQNERCVYPKFNLSCNNQSRAVINLPPAGEFVIKRINYESQYMYINDPDFCLPKKLLSLDLQYSPFRGEYLQNFTVVNCTNSESLSDYGRALPISCLSDHNFTVLALDSGPYNVPPPLNCQTMAKISVPVDDRFSMDLNKDLRLTWDVPRCGGCVAKGGTCGFKNSRGLQTDCFNVPRHGLPVSAKYGIIIGAGIPGLVFMIGIVCYICGKVRTYCRRTQPTEVPITTNAPHSAAAALVTGLDGPTIESYPKTVLGDSGRLPKPNDGPCPICLSDYQPKDVLRTIPECNHFFHADCVDEWLRMNATCPLCRNLPDGSSLVTPCSSMSLASSSTSSSS